MGLSLSPLCRRAIAVQLTADNGVEPARQSYLGNLAQVKGGGLDSYWTESEVFRCRAGNQALAERLARRLGEERVHLRAPVRAVELLGETAVVRCADDRAFAADQVVLAIPPPTWGRIRFDPPLSPVLSPQMGSNVKQITAVRDRYWERLGLSPDSLSDGDVSMTWDATDNQPGSAGAALTAFSGGPPAERLRALPPLAREGVYAAALEGIYPGLLAARTGSRFMDWPSDPWTLCGYAFPAPREVTTVGPLLRAGAGRLHFAGEHTCYAFIGYMEGALQSGIAAARRIAAAQRIAAAGRLAAPAGAASDRPPAPVPR